ncbi:SCO2400 family protein [Streptomyces sp. NBC_01334]|uniref:SCO2400 family protein n=1 Tax=Streptomyces sp. NBC_01334 TaxID=2903827 RepID=UPI002E150F9E|nr:hypothetical protein OG736_23320 [Streptomyces sp. NBC_01334]
MDYCSTCRRHLNGALVCPGCGAYAPDIAPVTVDRRIAPARVATTTRMSTPGPEPTPARLTPPSTTYADTGSYADTASSAAPSPDSESVPSATAVPYARQGRAARRRQLARWKKNQRRAVVATAVALVGGGLSFAAMDRQSGDQAQAATTPETPTTAGGEEPTLEHTLPTVSRSGAHRASPSPGTPLSSTNTHSDSLAPSPATVPSVPRQRTGTSSGDGTVTAPTGTAATTDTTGTSGTSGASGQQSSASTATDGTQSSNSNSASDSSNSSSSSSSSPSSSNSSSSSSTSTAPAGTSPTDVCLLGLICLG